MRTRQKLSAAALTISVILLVGCAGNNSPGSNPTGQNIAAQGSAERLTIASTADVTSFDPGQLDTGMQVTYWQAVYDTLLRFTADGKLEPNLATAYKYNDEGTVLTLTLREGITFTDGEPFNADAVAANIAHLKQGTGVSVYMVKSVATVKSVDEKTVEITLSAPDPAFTYYLSLVAGAMASPKALSSDTIASKPVGSGPYILDSAQSITGSEYIFTRNPDYWNASAFPYNTLVVKPMEDLTARVNALKSGQVNAGVADPSVVSEAESSNLQVGRNPSSWAGFIYFDRAGEKVPALSDVRVRQALNHAIDAEGILKSIYSGAGYVSTQIFNKRSEAAVSSLDKKSVFDPAKAKKLLAEAGYSAGFAITLPEIPGALLATYPIVTQQLADVGVTVTWDKLASDKFVPALMSGDYAMAVFGSSSGNPWRDIQKMISPSGAWNPFKSTNADIEGLISAAQKSTAEDQVKNYQAVNTYIVENAWFGVWFFSDNIFLTDAKTNVSQQSGSIIPYLRNFAPAGS